MWPAHHLHAHVDMKQKCRCAGGFLLKTEMSVGLFWSCCWSFHVQFLSLLLYKLNLNQTWIWNWAFKFLSQWEQKIINWKCLISAKRHSWCFLLTEVWPLKTNWSPEVVQPAAPGVKVPLSRTFKPRVALRDMTQHLMTVLQVPNQRETDWTVRKDLHHLQTPSLCSLIRWS